MQHRTLTRPLGLLALVVLAALLSGCGDLLGGQSPTAAPVVVIVTATPDPGIPATETPVVLGAEPTVAPGATAAPEATAEPAPTVAPGSTEAAPISTAVPAGTVQPAGGLLQRVQARDRLICGTNADLPGFGFYDNVRQNWSGFDVDFCRALAAAVLGDATKVDFVALNTSGSRERFAAVRGGEVDVLFRNTTWTLGRDEAALAFGPTTFHDGQTFLVRTDAGIRTSADLANKRVCVARGTTSEQNLSDDFAARGIAYEPVLFDDENELYPAYDEGACDAVTSDSSQLASKRQTLQNPADNVVLSERISREPLGPVFIEGDEQWRDVVTWTVFATMYAEELRVTQANVDAQADTQDPRIRRLLGTEGELGQGLRLDNRFAYNIIKQVGNYGDIYDRNLGPTTPFALDRGPNKAWNLGEGGVLFSPPFR